MVFLSNLNDYRVADNPHILVSVLVLSLGIFSMRLGYVRLVLDGCLPSLYPSDKVYRLKRLMEKLIYKLCNSIITE